PPDYGRPPDKPKSSEGAAAAANPASDVDRAKATGSGGNRWQNFAGLSRSIELSPAMIRNDQRFGAMLGRTARIVAAADTFHYDWQSRASAQPIKIFKLKVALEVFSDISGQARACHFRKIAFS